MYVYMYNLSGLYTTYMYLSPKPVLNLTYGCTCMCMCMLMYVHVHVVCIHTCVLSDIGWWRVLQVHCHGDEQAPCRARAGLRGAGQSVDCQRAVTP